MAEGGRLADEEGGGGGGRHRPPPSPSAPRPPGRARARLSTPGVHPSALPWWAPFGVVALAFAARAVWAWRQPGDRFTFPDSVAYDSVARNLLGGRGLAMDGAYDFAFRDRPGLAGAGYRAHFQPGYAVFLAGLYAAGLSSPPAVRLVQAALGAATVWLVMLLAREVVRPRGDGAGAGGVRGSGRAVELGAGLICALEPHLVFFAGMVLTETLFTFLITGSLVLIALASREGREASSRATATLAAASGLAAGLAALVRVTFLAYGPFVAAFVLLAAPRGRRRGALWPALAFAAAFLLALAPWTARNALVLGAFVPGSTRMGIALWDAFSPEARGGSDMDRIAWPAGLAEVTGEVERDRFLVRAALAEVRARPGRAAALAFARLGRLWSPVPWAEGYRDWRHRAASAAAFAVLVGGAGCALILLGARWRVWWPAAAPAAYLTLFTLVFAGSLRFRVPAHAGLSALAAVGWGLALERLRRRAARERLPPFPPARLARGRTVGATGDATGEG